MANQKVINEDATISTPDGLDDFLGAQDPQAMMAQQGFNQLGQMALESQPVQNIITGQGLQDYQNMLNAAMTGDPIAQQALAEHNAGMAMGTIQSVKPGLIGQAEELVGPGSEAASLAGKVDLAATAGQEGVSMKHLQAAQQKANREMDFRARNAKRYADGGEVEPSNEDISSLGSLSQDPNNALDRTPAGLDDFIGPELKEEAYGGLGQQAITGLEGAAQGIAGPLAPLAEEAIGIDPEAIRARKEVNPNIHMAGEIAGLAGSMATGIGEGALAAKGGEKAIEALGLKAAETFIPRVGSAAVKSAIENMVIASGDEASKTVLHDPNQSAQSALIDVGLNGLIGGSVGGALGSVHPLWKASMGEETHGILKTLTDKMGGIDNVSIDPIEQAIDHAGVEIAPEIKAGLSKDPFIQNMYQTLQESSSKSGIKAQAALKEFREKASEGIVSALGKTPEQVDNLRYLSDHDAGTEIKTELTNNLKAQIEPIANAFEKTRNKYSQEVLNEAPKARMSQEIADLVAKEGYALSPSSPQFKLIQNTLEEIPGIKTLEDVRKYQSILNDKSYGNPDLRRVGAQLKSILRSVEEDTVTDVASKITPDALAEHLEAKKAYSSAMNLIDNLNDRLHVGKYSGPKTFISALKEMSPEDILRRLSPKGDAGIIKELSVFPGVSEKVRDYHLAQALKVAANKAQPGELINTKAFLTSLEKMSPEMKDFLVSPEARLKIDAIDNIMNQLPSKMNTSGTAKTLDALWNHIPGSAAGLATLLLGHGPVSALVVGKLAKVLGKDAPDAIKLSMLKFLGSSEKIEAEGFKSMVDFINSSLKGQNTIAKGIKNVFTGAKEVIPQSFFPTEKDRAKLDKFIKKSQTDPESLLNIGSKSSHYMSDTTTAMTSAVSNAAQYLNSLRPDDTPKSPLDPKLPVSATQKSKYNRALDIAQQPMIVMEDIKKGTITPFDVTSIKTMYPDLYSSMCQKLSNRMTDVVAKGELIPYKTRMGLSLFMGQSLDSSMTPIAIQNAQPKTAIPAQMSPHGGQKPPSANSTKSLDKFSQQFQSPAQARGYRQQKQ